METTNERNVSGYEELRLKGEAYLESGEVHSDIIANLGKPSNLDQLSQLGEYIETNVRSSADKVEFVVPEYPEDDANDAEKELLQPLLTMAQQHFRSYFNIPHDAVIEGGVTVASELVAASNGGIAGVDTPHVDGDLAHPENEVNYIAVVGGWPTIIWKGAFDHPERPETFEDREKLYSESGEYQRQIVEKDMPRVEVEEGDVVCLDSHAVHASAAQEMAKHPELIGQDRKFISIRFKLSIEPDAQTTVA